MRTLLGWGSAALWAVAVLLWALDVAGRGLPPAVDRAAVLGALLFGAGWLGARAFSRQRAGWIFAALVVLSFAVRLAGIDHEVEGRYYRDEGTYYHHATEINAGRPLRLSFVYPHLTYNLEAFVLWAAGLFPGAVAGWARGVYGVEEPLAVSWLLLRAVVAVLSALTVVPVYRMAERLAGPAFGTAAGAAAALLLILSPLYNDGSHLNISDVPSAFFATACLFFVSRLVEGERTRDYLLAGVFAGCAAGSKYPAGVVAVAIAGVWTLWRIQKRDFQLGLLWSGLAALATFVAVMPSLLFFPEAAFLGGRGMFFGVRQYGRGGWLGVTPGNNGLWYARQLLGSFGLASLVAGVTGWVALPRERRFKLFWMLPFPVLYLALIASMNMVVRRNLYPAIPILAVLLGLGIAAWLAALVQEGPLFRLAATGLVLVCLWPVASRTAEQEIGLARDSTRELAAAWIRANVPRGAGILKETYTPNLPADEYAVLHRRFAARVPLAEVRDGRFDYVLLASASYVRFLEPEELEQAHQREMAERYGEIFRSFQLVREWTPSATRLGPELRLYRVPDPAVCDAAVLPVGGAFVPDGSMRAETGRALRYDVDGQWALFKKCLEPGRYQLTLRGRIVPAGGGKPGGEVRVEGLTSGELALLRLGDRARVDLDLPGRGKYLFYIYLPAGSRLRGVAVEETPASPAPPSSDGSAPPSGPPSAPARRSAG